MTEAENHDDDPHLDEVAEIVAKILSYASTEPALIQRAEKIFDPPPANIFADAAEAEELQKHIRVVFAERFSQGLVLQSKSSTQESERLRTYHIDIANELTRTFHVCRNAVCRLHMLYIGLECLRTRPEFWKGLTKEAGGLYADTLERSFWDAVEIATIRLVSYWDRVGQLLDFVFFNIRQYERDGFPAVLERIKKNFALTFGEFGAEASYKALIEYANSERPTGFKWLVRRRNLTVHSTQFRPHKDKRDALFEYEYNHYEARVIRDLALKSPKEELELIHVHLAKAAELFRGAFDLAGLGIDLIEEDVRTRRR